MRIRRIGACAVLVALFFAAGISSAPMRRADPLVQGLDALDTRSFEKATYLFEQALAEARQQGDRSGEAKILFYLGLACHQDARQQEGGDRPRLLQKAARFYEEALEIRRELREPTAPILNNLAQVYADMGTPEDLARAEELLQEAAAGGGRGSSFYLSNQAVLLEQQGKHEEAARLYRAAAEGDPANLEAHWAALKHLGEELFPYLRCRLANGQIDLAQESALRLLEEGGDPAPDKPRLLAIVTEALARQCQLGDPRESPVIQRLDGLRADAEVGPGIVELQQTLAGNFDVPCCFWWASHRGHEDVAEAFQNFLLVLGRRTSPDQAERYFLRALDVGGPEASAQVFVELADLYSRTRETEKLDQLARKYTLDLLDAKMLAYRRSSWREAYYLHRALGVTYAILGRWGDSSRFDSAIFQLEHAREAAERYNRELESAPPAPCGTSLKPQGPIPLEPGLTAHLAEGYEKTERLDDAIHARLDSAEGYLKLGDTKAAQMVLAPVRKQYGSLSPEDQKRLQTLQNN